MFGFSNRAAKTATLSEVSTKQIIEEIHETFFTEVDRLLASAKVSRSLETDKQGLIDKCEKLKKLGFTNTKEVQAAEAEISRLSALKLENAKKQDLIAAIEYFSVKYPNYKFITEESVKKICAKYNLIYGEIAKYIGTVPDKNLKHIEDFKIDEKDKACIREVQVMGGWGMEPRKHYVDYADMLNFAQRGAKDAINDSSYYTRYENFYPCTFEIAAPLKDFDMREHEVKGFKLSKIEIPDPVVLCPVMFRKQKHYLIVTAWGDEASDELVVNQKMN